jgi:TPR repeat protein
MYANGAGVGVDMAEALAWYRKAAALGDARAMTCIGWMLEKGDGVEVDEVEALVWYRKAAALGSTLAEDQLARIGRTESVMP